MGADFVDNIYLSVKIVLLKKRNILDVDSQISLLQELALNEIVECTAPLAFLFSFLVAYYGPNSDLIGNMKSDLWQFRKVEEIEQFLANVLMIFFTDLSSLAVTALILWTFGRINLFLAIMAIQKEFNLIMLIILGHFVVMVRARLFHCWHL